MSADALMPFLGRKTRGASSWGQGIVAEYERQLAEVQAKNRFSVSVRVAAATDMIREPLLRAWEKGATPDEVAQLATELVTGRADLLPRDILRIAQKARAEAKILDSVAKKSESEESESTPRGNQSVRTATPRSRKMEILAAVAHLFLMTFANAASLTHVHSNRIGNPRRADVMKAYLQVNGYDPSEFREIEEPAWSGYNGLLDFPEVQRRMMPSLDIELSGKRHQLTDQSDSKYMKLRTADEVYDAASKAWEPKLKGADGIWQHYVDNLINDFRKFGVNPRTDRAVRYEVRLYERTVAENVLGSVLNMFGGLEQPGEFVFGNQPARADNGYIIDFPEKKLALSVSIDINNEHRLVEKVPYELFTKLKNNTRRETITDEWLDFGRGKLFSAAVPDGAGRFIASPASPATAGQRGQPVEEVVRETVGQLLDPERVKLIGYEETDEQIAHDEAVKVVVPGYDAAQRVSTGDARGGINSGLRELHDEALQEAVFGPIGKRIGKKTPKKRPKPNASNLRFSSGRIEENSGKSSANGGRRQSLRELVPTPSPLLNPNAPAFVPRSQFNPDAPAFVPRSRLNPDAPTFVPRSPQLTYPSIPSGTVVAPKLLHQIVNLPPSERPYQIIGQWHDGFESWAYQHGFNKGTVAHFNVQARGGPMLHVYWNANGQLEVVPHGGKPKGY